MLSVMTEVPRVFWCLPGQSVQNLGLADITNDDCSNMAAAVSVGNKLLYIYVDHDDSMRMYNNDIVFHFPSPQLAAQKTGVNISREKRQLNFDTEYEFDSDGSDNEEVIFLHLLTMLFMPITAYSNFTVIYTKNSI